MDRTVRDRRRTDRTAINARDAGLTLVGRVNRWMIAGAVGLTGMISLVAARSFHGHTASSSAASQPASSASSSAGSSSSSSSGGSSSSSSGGLSQPSQAPSSSSGSSAPAPVVSGGS